MAGEDEILRVGLDSSGYTRGAAEITRSTAEMRAHVASLIPGIGALVETAGRLRTIMSAAANPISTVSKAIAEQKKATEAALAQRALSAETLKVAQANRDGAQVALAAATAQAKLTGDWSSSREAAVKLRDAQTALITTQKQHTDVLQATASATRTHAVNLAGFASAARVAGGAALGLGAAVGVAAIAVVPMIREFGQAEAATLRFEAAMKAAGNTTGLTRSEIEDLVSEIEGKSLFSDEDIREGIATLNAFRVASKDTFKDVAQLTADIAALQRNSFAGAANLVGRAFAQPGENLALLNRQLRVFNDEDIKAIRNLADTGDKSAAVAAAMEKLKGRADGLGESMTKGLSGGFSKFTKQLGETAENIGDLIANMVKLDSATSFLKELGIRARVISTPTPEAKSPAEIEAERVKVANEAAQKAIQDTIDAARKNSGDFIPNADAIDKTRAAIVSFQAALATDATARATDDTGNWIRALAIAKEKLDQITDPITYEIGLLGEENRVLRASIEQRAQEQRTLDATRAVREKLGETETAYARSQIKNLADAKAVNEELRRNQEFTQAQTSQQERLRGTIEGTTVVYNELTRAYEANTDAAEINAKTVENMNRGDAPEMARSRAEAEVALARALREKNQEIEKTVRLANAQQNFAEELEQQKQINEANREAGFRVNQLTLEYEANDSRARVLAKTFELVKQGFPTDEARQMAEEYVRAADATRELEREQEKLRQQTEANDWTLGARRGLERYRSDALNLAKNVENAVVNSFSAMEDHIVEFVKTGKFNFRSLADSIISDLIRIGVRMAITAAIGGAGGGGGLLSGIFGLFGGGGAAPAPPITNIPVVPVGGAPVALHTGGIVGSGGFSHRGMGGGGLRYHSGGVVGEREIIAQDGEEVLRRDDPRHRYNGGGAVSVQVYDMRTGGAPVETQSSEGPDGRRMIRVMIREEMDRALSSGSMDRAMGSNFGIRRPPVKRG